MGAISDKGILLLGLCACHLFDKWSYCGQCCTVSGIHTEPLTQRQNISYQCIELINLSDLFISALEYLHLLCLKAVDFIPPKRNILKGQVCAWLLKVSLFYFTFLS